MYKETRSEITVAQALAGTLVLIAGVAGD